MKKTLLALSLAALSSAAPSFASHASTDLTALDRDVEIMKNIVETALKQDTRGQAIRFRRIEATYLAQQGVMFTINTSSRGHHFKFDFLEEVMPLVEGMDSVKVGVVATDDLDAMPPLPPLPPMPNAGEIIEDVLNEVEVEFLQGDVESAIHRAQDQQREVREMARENWEKLRSLKEQLRDLAWEQREHEREKRDLEFQLRRSKDDAEDQQEAQTRLQELETRIQALASKTAEVKAHSKEVQAAQKQRMQQKKAKQAEAYKRFLMDFEAIVGETLCRYGAGLKALPDNEYVTFVLEGFGKGNGRRAKDKQDRIYVFSKARVKDCVAEKIDANTLLTEVKAYEF